MRAGPGPGGRPQRDVRKPLARHAAHGSEEAAEPPESALGASARPPAASVPPSVPPAVPPTAPPFGQPATFAPHDGRQPGPYGAAPSAPSVPGAAVVPPVAVPLPPGLPPVAPVPPGPMTSALPTSLNYRPSPVAEPPVAEPYASPYAGPTAHPAARQYAEPYAVPLVPGPAAPSDPGEADGYRIRSAAVEGETLLPTRRSRRDSGSHRTGPPVKGSAPSSALGAVAEVVVVVVLALVLAVVVKSFLVQAFSIPSGSMEDTLLVGDRVLVNKLTPRVFDLHRGDVVVFADSGHWLDPVAPAPENPVKHALRSSLTFIGLLPDQADEHLIKRVIGLPGDKVVCCDASGRLTVNGHPVDEPYLRPGVVPSEKRFSVVVPQGRLWVMGDNRSFSADSRSHMNLPGGGTVPESDVVGKAFAVVWPFGRFGGLGIPGSVFAGVPPASGGS